MSAQNSRRSRSLPPKRTARRQAVCLFYRLLGSCCWGNLCSYTHEAPKIRYVERPAPRTAPTPERPPEYLVKLQKLHKQIARSQRNEILGKMRVELLQARAKEEEEEAKLEEERRREEMERVRVIEEGKQRRKNEEGRNQMLEL